MAAGAASAAVASDVLLALLNLDSLAAARAFPSSPASSDPLKASTEPRRRADMSLLLGLVVGLLPGMLLTLSDLHSSSPAMAEPTNAYCFSSMLPVMAALSNAS